MRLDSYFCGYVLPAGMRVWVVYTRTRTRIPNGYMILLNNIPTGRKFISYPPLYRVIPVGYSGFGYPLPSLRTHACRDRAATASCRSGVPRAAQGWGLGPVRVGLQWWRTGSWWPETKTKVPSIELLVGKEKEMMGNRWNEHGFEKTSISRYRERREKPRSGSGVHRRCLRWLKKFAEHSLERKLYMTNFGEGWRELRVAARDGVFWSGISASRRTPTYI
jgi:hypothetical protein